MADFDDESLYDSFYGSEYKKYEIPDTFNIHDRLKILANINRQQSQKIEQMSAARRKKEQKGHTPTRNAKTDAIREMIMKGATMGYTPQRPKPPSVGQKKLPIIDNVKIVKNIEDFTPETYGVGVSFIDHGHYSIQRFTKIVGMEQVEWWEYVMVYGFIKAAYIYAQYSAKKELIKHGVQSTATVGGKVMGVNFYPKIKSKPSENVEILEGQKVIRRTGTLYEKKLIYIEIPLKKVPRKQEYQEGLFLYEENYEAFEPDFEKLKENLVPLLRAKNVPEAFIEIIVKSFNANG